MLWQADSRIVRIYFRSSLIRFVFQEASSSRSKYLLIFCESCVLEQQSCVLQGVGCNRLDSCLHGVQVGGVKTNGAFFSYHSISELPGFICTGLEALPAPRCTDTR